MHCTVPAMRPERVRPETRYAQGADGSYVAFQVFGSGPLELVFITSWLTNLDAMWEEPSLAAYLDRLGSFARIVCFDKRGSGVSDPVPLTSLPTLEHWMDDARTVMDAVGVEQAALLGDTEGGPMTALFAATHPDRARALVLVNSFARWRRADDYPIGMPDGTAAKLVERYEQNWGVTSEILDLTAPSAAQDPRFRAWFTRYQRLAMPRGAATTMYRWVTELDIRCVLSTIRIPTLVVQRTGARHHRAAFGRYLAEEIPNARYVELPGMDTFPFHTGDFSSLLDEVEEFLTGARARPVLGRQLATILFTDIVDSTRIAAERGDAGWRELVAAHDAIVRDHLQRYRGREVANTGDGFLAIFDGPARAVTCAVRLGDALRDLGMTVRGGLHTGEVELSNGDVRGLAVHIAARVMATAERGGVLVSGTVKDLVVGSGIEFLSRGERELKGVPGSWPLYEATSVP
jgi:class 3 adenylate cyclase/pimeloyl-ACP methyl ester carboxylesterase